MYNLRRRFFFSCGRGYLYRVPEREIPSFDRRNWVSELCQWFFSSECWGDIMHCMRCWEVSSRHRCIGMCLVLDGLFPAGDKLDVLYLMSDRNFSVRVGRHGLRVLSRRDLPIRDGRYRMHVLLGRLLFGHGSRKCVRRV